MAVNGVYDSAGYAFGSLASIRRQAQAIGNRVKAENEARIAEQEKTGLIKNPDTGEMVELSSISEQMRDNWEQIEQARSVSPKEAMIGFMATAPHADEIEEDKARAAKFAKIQDKMLAGKKITGAEFKFLKENYPQLAATATRMEQEAAQLEQKLRGSKTKEGKHQSYVDAKMKVMSSMSKDGGDFMFLSAALDEAYARHIGRGSAFKEIDTWAWIR